MATYCPPARLAVMKQSGFDHIRLAVDTAPMEVAADDAAIDVYIAKVGGIISNVLSAGLMVNVNLTPNITGWSGHGPTDVLDGVGGTKFLRYKYVVARIAAYIQANAGIYPPGAVAISVWNEMYSSDSALSYASVRALHTAVRAVAPLHSIIVSPWSFGAMLHITDMTASDFDTNTIYDIHAYEPQTAARQGEVGTIWEPISRLTYPPQSHSGGYSAALAQYTAATSPTPVPSWVTGSFNYEGLRCYFGSGAFSPNTDAQDVTWLKGYFYKVAADWANAAGIPRKAILIGEFGANGDWNSMLNLDAASRTRLLADIRAAVDYHGFRVSYLAIDNVDTPAHLGGTGGWGNGYGLFYNASPYAAVNTADIAAMTG